MQKIGLEVSSLRGILEAMKDTIEDAQDASDWQATFKALKDPGNPIETLSLILKPLNMKLKKESAATGLKKLTKSLPWPLNSQATKDVLFAIERQKSLLMIALENDHVRLSAEIKRHASNTSRMVLQIQEDIRELDKVISTLALRQKDETETQALLWLSKLDYDTTQADILRQRHSLTGKWFLQSSEFKSWLHGDQKMIYCPGIPGAGNTVMCAAVIQHMLDEFGSQQDDIAITWVYCNFKSRDAQSTNAMLGSTAMQIARRCQPVLDFVCSLRAKGRRNRTAGIDESMAVLQKAVERYSKVFIVVDALDEYNAEDDGWRDFVDKLCSLRPGIRLMITSRPVPSIVKYFSAVVRKDVSAQDEYLLLFVRARLQDSVFRKHLDNDVVLESLIERTLVSKSQGMFLLTRLHADSLQKKAKYNKAELRKGVETLPNKLDETYDNALQRISAQDADDAHLAKQVISWIMYTFEWLSPRMLQQRLSRRRSDDPLDPDTWIDTDVLFDICAGLVIFHQESQTVRFVHYTTAEYLSRHFHTFYDFGLPEVNYTCFHHALGSGALNDMFHRFSTERVHYFYYSMLTEEEISTDIKVLDEQRARLYDRDPLARYALAHIYRYSDHAVPGVLNKEGTYSQDYNMFWSRHIEKAMDIMFDGDGVTKRKPGDVNDLRLAVFFNFSSEATRILSLPGSQEMPSEDTKARSLCLAAVNGYDEIVSLLLNAEADASRSYSVKGGGHEDSGRYVPPSNSVEWAIIGKHESTIVLIRKHCPDLPAKKMKIYHHGEVELEKGE